MEILECEINGVKGYKCGENGVCHIGMEAMQRALRERAKKQAEEYERNPAPLKKKEKPPKIPKKK